VYEFALDLADGLAGSTYRTPIQWKAIVELFALVRDAPSFVVLTT
jgi:hypothetical protein